MHRNYIISAVIFTFFLPKVPMQHVRKIYNFFLIHKLNFVVESNPHIYALRVCTGFVFHIPLNIRHISDIREGTRLIHIRSLCMVMFIWWRDSKLMTFQSQVSSNQATACRTCVQELQFHRKPVVSLFGNVWFERSICLCKVSSNCH